MPITKRGVYHNLKESKYVISNSEVTFFFSSEHTLNKFMNGYQKHREEFNKKNEKLADHTLNYDMLADSKFYNETEKRGFYVWLKGVTISKEELSLYVLRKMIEKNSPEWVRTERPRTVERFR